MTLLSHLPRLRRMEADDALIEAMRIALEAAAKTCWNPEPDHRSAWERGLGDYAEGQESAYKACADAIRALAETLNKEQA